ncbi:flagellar basal body rod protein FlgB [Desulfitibacter alkalitolerans]|uniref:flagellar basal body rod protein FlgB n=1 Tax=Desulfitibacter alkalitolerans TaxID=264641 RepID=UPI00048744CB|nr:flagellar basal body rod protein FlgB [Desulfitibacter alkalitolerans]
MNVLRSDVMIALQKALDGSSVRQSAIANNIANVNTPGYKRKEVSFENELRVALKKSGSVGLTRTHPEHIHKYPALLEIKPRVLQNDSQSMRPDNNNVDLDQEMTKMAANSIYYNSLISQLNKRIGILKHTISEGRR